MQPRQENHSEELGSAARDEPPVFLNYTREELDRNFNQRVWASNAEAVIAKYRERSSEAREHLRLETVRYGDSPDEVLDIFPASSRNAPINVFVHGGAWLHFTKDDYSFVAIPLVAAGITTIVLNFTNLPQVSLSEMIAQVRRGIRWAGENATRFGGDPQALSVSGWSSGAHLAAMALVNSVEESLSRGGVKLAFCVSGPYDMEPVMLSARSAYVKITKDQQRLLSPRHNADHYDTSFFLAYAEKDTDEFRRQSLDFAAVLDRVERLAGTRCFSGLNHFELAETLGIRGAPLSNLLIEKIKTFAR
jgi:arylformamidase